MRHDEEQRAEILRDAKLLGVEEACRKHGIHRSTLYRMKTRGTVAAEPEGKVLLRDRIRDLALEHPSWGCDRLAFFLSFEGTKVSSPTVQKILTESGLGRRIDRERARNAREATRPVPPLIDVHTDASRTEHGGKRTETWGR